MYRSVPRYALAAMMAAALWGVPVTSRGGGLGADPTLVLPPSWRAVDALIFVGDRLYVGGHDAANHGRFGAYDTATGTFTDESWVLPGSYFWVRAFAYGGGELLLGAQAPSPNYAGQLGVYSPSRRTFVDLSGPMHAPVPYMWWLNAIAFNGRNFLIAGAGPATGLMLYAPGSGTFTSLAGNLPHYIATNTIATRGSDFLILGAGAGSGGEPGTPPAMGWVHPDGSFADLTGAIPSPMGVIGPAAFNGSVVLLRGVSTQNGRQVLDLFQPSTSAFTSVDELFAEPGLSIDSIAASGRRFIIGGHIVNDGYLAIYDPRSGDVESISGRLPASAKAVTAADVSGDTAAIGGGMRGNRAFISVFGVPREATVAASPPSALGAVVYSSNATLYEDVHCSSLTILPGVTLTTNGHNIYCTGRVDNEGTIDTGFAPYQDAPDSHGGSGGGGGASCASAGGQNGYSTLAPGGNGFTSVTGGGSVPPPQLTNELIRSWHANGMARHLEGAAGGGNPTTGYTGTPGAYGIYIQANSMDAGTINAAGLDNGQGPQYGSGGGGGGVVILAYGSGGYRAATINVSGGHGNPGGCYPSGNGGDGAVLPYYYGANAPIEP